MSKKLKIFHLGDMQIELRVTGIGAQRYHEFDTVLNINVIEAIIDEQPDLVVIPGDLFEYELTTADEQKMLSTFLRNILKIECVKRIIIIPGNHDIKQNHNGLIIGGSKINTTDSIDSIVSSINNPRISYYRHTGIYKDSIYDLSWAVWSQVDKHSALEVKPAYSPWIDNEVPTTPFIELYHDPINTCVGFDRKTPFYLENYKVSLNDFKSNCILAADIHAPQIIWFENNTRLFTYPSSTVMRNFGEGDYFTNEKLIQEGNRMHGYNIVIYDLEAGQPVSCEFKQVQNPVYRFTIHLDDEFDYSEDSIRLIASNLTQSSINLVRIVCESNITKFIESQDLILSVFRELVSNVKIEFAHSENVLGIEIDTDAFETLDNIIDKSKILEISDKYINQVVDSTSIVQQEDKDEVKERIYEFLKDQLSNTTLTSDTNIINFESLELYNFMNFDEAKVTFTDNKINVIKGSNRVGKTTIMHGLNWLLTDQISKGQNLRNSKYNNSQYFNNNSELDEVVGIGRFYRNNKHHELTKTITRKWKRNQKDIRAKNILSHIANIEVTYSMVIEGTQTLTNEETKQYLSELFSFNSLSQMTFINSTTIDDMMNMSIEDMSQSFLEQLGLDISGILESMYDDLKDKELSKITKPNITLEEAHSRIDILQTELDSDIEAKLVKDKEVEELDNKTSELIRDIKSKRNELHSVMDIDEYNQKLSDINTKLISINSNIDKGNEWLANFKEMDIEAIREEIKNSNDSILLLHSEINSINDKIQKTQRSINHIKELGSERKQALDSELNIEINKLIDKQNELRETINSNELKFQENMAKIESYKNLEIEKHQSNIATHHNKLNEINSQIHTQELHKLKIESGISATKTKIDNLTDELEKLKHSTICTQCLQVLPEEALEVINNKVISIENELETLESNNKNEAEQLQSQLESISELKNLLTQYTDKINKENVAIESIRSGETKFEQVLEYEAIGEALLELNNNLKVDIQNIESEISKLNAAKIETIKNDKTLNRYVQEISELNIGIERSNIEIESVNDKIKEYSVLKSEHEDKLESAIKHNKAKDNVVNKLNELNVELRNTNDLKESHILIEPKILENIEIQKVITELDNKLATYNSEMRLKYNELSEINSKLSKGELELNMFRKTIEDIRNYKLVDSSLTLYRRIIGKRGLPQYVFAHIIPILNQKLNESISDVDFRLLFDEDTLELRFYSLSKDVTQPLQFISGMERTVTGLAISYIKRILNHSNRFNFIFIDEISGTLNDGKDLSYEAKDYQDIVKKFLDKLSETVSIYIIDHSLKFNECRVLEVVPGPNGSTIIEQ